MPPKPENPDEPRPLTTDDHLQAMLHLQTAANNQNYFTYYNVPHNQRITLAVFYFTRDALIWYKHLATNRLLSTWPEFTQAIEARFGPSTYENHQATLFKLRQTTSVSAYQAEFEKISNCVDDLPVSALRNCFISGLRQDIQSEIAVHNPQSLPETYSLAKLIEDKLTASRNRYSPFNRSSTTSSQQRYNQTNTTSSTTLPAVITPTTSTKTVATLPLTKLSPEALQKRRAEGLCFRCPAKFHPGHVCNPPQFLLIADNEDFPNVDVTSPFPPPLTDDQIDPQPPTSPETPSTTHTPHFLSLSDAAFFGLQSPRALRVTGHINGHPVTTLVDCGSTHNIIQPRTANLLKLTPTKINSFPVMIGNGQNLECNGVLPNVQLELNRTTFHVPLFVVPVEGADIILGLAWLSSLGPIIADFSIPQLSFTVNNRQCTLKGEPFAAPVSPSSLHTLLRKQAVASLHTMIFHHQPPTPNQSPPQTHTDPIVDKLLTQFQPLFEPPQGLPPSRNHDHHIPVNPTASPVNIRPYRYPHYQKEIMTKLITEMLQEGVIQPSTSPYSSPVLLVRKKDGSWRFCVDYRGLNAITVRDRFPIPTVDELLDELHGAKVFSKIDLRAGYHQIRVAAKDVYKTAFRTIDGHYEFQVMPFGLTNAPATFQSAMNDLFRPVLCKFVVVFFDDILVYSPSLSIHYEHLTFVFQQLLNNHYRAKASKCLFAVDEIPFLGHIITTNGVKADPEKITAIQQWAKPHSFTTLRAFLGLTGYYRRFVPSYAHIAAPLTDILKQPLFNWTTTAAAAFSTLKSAMADLITLALPNFGEIFDVTTDASGMAIGAVLSQTDKPIAFFSKNLCNRMQNQSTYTRELYAITESIKKWRQYLLGRRFRVYTDHHSLKHLLTQTIQTPEQHKWLAKILGYDFELHFKPGKENRVADALSRVESSTLMALSTPTAPWLTELHHYYSTHPEGQRMITELEHSPSSRPKHTIQNGLVYVVGRLFIPNITSLRFLLLQEFHTSTLGGHAGVQATIRRLATTFSWPGLKQDVTKFVQQCATCQAIKYPTHKPYGLLQALPIPAYTWSDITMDFITHLPPSNGKTAIWVIVDRLSKAAHFIALPTHYTAITLAPIFLKDIYRLHGLPNSIVSDRDPLFLSQFWTQLFKQLGTKLKHSSAYHPQTDGQSEVVNRCLESYLRAFACEEPRTWHRYLYLAEFWYNTSFHSAIQMSPFKAVYGREATSIHEYSPGTTNTASIEETLLEHQRIITLLKASLTRAREKMTTQANKKRQHKEFSVGEFVYLRLRNYRQHSVEARANQKLAKRFFGPFQIMERIRPVAYRLQLPATSKVHPVFHVSLLKKSHLQVESDEFPDEWVSDFTTNTATPYKLLQRRQSADNRTQVLIEWTDQDIDTATWEDEQDIQIRFPSFQVGLEDESVFMEEGIDTPHGSSTHTTAQSNATTRPKRRIILPARFRD
ncbi:hypothetical protein LXL04_007604 [Taraxacum kok-saghyz]